jgi:hypothetical protein
LVYVVKLSVSIIIGLVHSIVIERLDHIVVSVEFINSSHGFFKSTKPFSCIVKIPISEVAQNLFLRALKILKLSYLSHSKYNTVSTICSNVFGQARFQSLFICHIIKTAVLVVFAYVTNSSVIYLTCDTLHVAHVMLFECITDIESIINNLHGFLIKVSSISSIQLSHNTFILFHQIHNLSALDDI